VCEMDGKSVDVAECVKWKVEGRELSIDVVAN